MIVSLIVAMGKNRVIGRNNSMMWHLPQEYKYFKETTTGHCIITGRKNFEAVGRALPNRTNIIVTRNTDLIIKDDVVIVNSIEDALDYARARGESEVFICGGGEIYKQSLDLVDRMYITYVDYNENGDVYFPEFDESQFDKKELKSMNITDNNKYAWTAYLYERKK
jgi:dihydrofolate reductase